MAEEYVEESYETEEMVAAAAAVAESEGYESEPARHTKFLDLTKAEGAVAAGASVGFYGDVEASGNNTSAKTVASASGSASQDEVDALVDAHLRQTNNNPAARGTIRVDPNTPGKVVEAGQEHTGRWTKEEHEAFLSALQMYGKEWKKVAAKVKTRTVVQTRTHAQKYFQKLQKAMESGGAKEDIGAVEMGTAPEAKKASSTKKKRGNTPSIAAKPRPPNISAISSLTSAAQSIQTPTGDSQARLNNVAGFGAPAATAATAAVAPAAVAPPAAGGGSGMGLSTTAAAILSRTQAGQAQFPRHGFSTGSDSSFRSQYASGYQPLNDRGWAGSTSIKITAPDPDASIKSGSFPEPSPAACGKRKLAEIAAARMLAGVAAGGKPLLLSAVGNEADGDVTPPPGSPGHAEAPGLTLNDVPAPPLIGGGGAGLGVGMNAARKAAQSLQIVNPESLGVDYDESKRRRANGDGSPQTPWEGQLKALVSIKDKQDKMEEDTPETEEEKKPTMILVPEGGIHPVCGPGSSFARAPLHRAVCEMDLAGLQSELSAAANGNVGVLSNRDELGYTPLHSACALGLIGLNRPDVPCEMVRQLVAAGAEPSLEDENGNTPLHWSARAGDKDVAELLLRKNCPKDAANRQGETPLHWAMRAGRKGMEVVGVLLENGARASSLNKSFKRPVDVAADGFEDDPNTSAPKRQLEKPLEKKKRVTKEEKRVLLEVTEERKEVRENLLKRSAQSRTLVLHHPECLEHTPKSSSDWEAPDRITAIMGRVAPPDADVAGKSVLMPYEVTLSSEFERAKLDLLSRVHSTDYLAFVNDLSKDLEKRQKEEEEAAGDEEDASRSGALTPPVVPFTPMVQRSMIKIEESRVKLGAHSDTSFSVGSLRAARRAAGAVQHAVDCVLVGRNRNAMCIVRPPGHHAGVNGLLDGGESCGFCIFNNVAAGALHAISDERLLCERCAIVDIDVHHGNGTEEIVKKCHDPGKLFFFSIHLYDNEKKKQKSNAFQYKFYPGTGAEDDVAFNIINVAITPLWKEPSTEKAVNTHNTRQKTRQKITATESNDDSEMSTPRDSKDNGRFSDADSETPTSAAKPTVNTPAVAASSSSASSTTSGTAGRYAYRQAIQNRLLPALRAFNPDLILISAGFDAARLDVGNARHERGGERMGLDLEPEDYAWTTRKILEIADICCQGRVVSVLEGGYGRSTPGPGLELDRSNLAECAVRHLHSMVDPYDCECRFPV